jgi:ABC-type enterobactin transport system permease subunit
MATVTAITGPIAFVARAFPGTAAPAGAVTVCLGGLYPVWLLARETGRLSPEPGAQPG